MSLFDSVDLGDLLKTGTDLGVAAIGGGAKPAPVAQHQTAVAPVAAKPNYVLWGSIGGGVLLLVVVALAFKK